MESRSREEDRGPQRGDLPKIRFESTPRPIIPATERNYDAQELLVPESRYSQYLCQGGDGHMLRVQIFLGIFFLCLLSEGKFID